MTSATLGSEIRAQQRANDAFDQACVERLGINRTDGRCLDLLEEYGPLPAGELARRSGLTTGAVTSLLDRLERAGFVRRAADPGDRRRVMVELTDEARRRIHELFGPMFSDFHALLAKFSDEELEVVLRFVRGDCEIHERRAARLAGRDADVS